MSRPLSVTFERAKAASRIVLVGYLPAGFPEPGRFAGVVQEAAACGLDVLELGLPVDDPFLDGPVIRQALEWQRQRGIGLDEALALGREARQASGLPVVVMGYASQLGAFTSVLDLVYKVASCGLDGLLLPDLDPGALSRLVSTVQSKGLGIVGFASASEGEDGLLHVLDTCQATSGFVYLQSAAPHSGGVIDLTATSCALRRVLSLRGARKVPVAVGFGIHEPTQVAALRRMGADGVAVGTALVKAASDLGRLKDLVSSLAAAAGVEG
ncbi:MAG TPA: tryptophan synthase subunit alpha [Limnochordales bacterium]